MKTKQNKKKNREFIHQLYYKNRINFIVTIILTIAMSSLNLMISWLIQQIMDCTANQDMQALVRSAWIVIIVVVTTSHAAVPRLCIFAADTEKFALFFKRRHRTLRFRADK